MKLTRSKLKQIILEEMGSLIYFQAFKIPESNEFRIATNRREMRQWGYTLEHLPKESPWRTAIEKLMGNEGEPEHFPEGEWRDVHYTPSDGIVKHFRRGLPYA